jgi:2-polyprenyl-3-methyl-5-hydroxy-6-metoxy-1,4-benzoquinol methylase
MTSDYDSIARDYHWLVPDELLSGDSFVERHRDLLGSLPRHALILDCACGIGLDAIVLARRGYRVCSSDASSALVTEHASALMQLG